jgi:hypothetical protein
VLGDALGTGAVLELGLADGGAVTGGVVPPLGVAPGEGEEVPGDGVGLFDTSNCTS